MNTVIGERKPCRSFSGLFGVGLSEKTNLIFKQAIKNEVRCVIIDERHYYTFICKPKRSTGTSCIE